MSRRLNELLPFSVIPTTGTVESSDAPELAISFASDDFSTDTERLLDSRGHVIERGTVQTVQVNVRGITSAGVRTRNARRRRRRRKKKPKWGVNGKYGPAKGFRWHEAKCNDGTNVPKRLRGNAVRAARSANIVRRRIARRYRVSPSKVVVIVNSWYRTPNHNANVGGEPNSMHLTSGAMDIVVYIKTSRGRKVVPPSTVAALSTAAFRIRRGGIGTYSCFVHVDVRRDGPARWVGVCN